MPVIDQCITDRFALYNSDTMEVLPTLPDESIDLCVYSPPFPELYQYSDDPRDVTNCVSYNEAIEHLGYVVEQTARVLKPGRITAVHTTDLKWGQLYQRDFPGSVVQLHEKYSLRFFCRITIWREAWEFARRTRMKSLMHCTIVEDSAKSRIAPADYIMVFLKTGENKVPVTHKTGFRHYAGGKLIPARLRDYLTYSGDQKANSLSHWIYRQYASPCWMDIRRGRLLPFNESKENPEERHVCPLQLDTIERCVVMWSNPGETILTPFAGIGSEVWMSVRLGRKAIGAELKASYYRQALANMEMVDRPEDGDLKFGMSEGGGKYEDEYGDSEQEEKDDGEQDQSFFGLSSLPDEQPMDNSNGDVDKPEWLDDSNKPDGYWTDEPEEPVEPAANPVPAVPVVQRVRPGRKPKSKATGVSEPSLPGL